MLIEKTKCIKKHVKLSKDFYSEYFFVAAHILNQTSSSSLSWDSSLIFMQKLLKKSIRNEIVHFKMFDCKAFSLLKKTDALKKNEKMKSRTFIKYLIKYNFINIFRVCNSKKDDVNDYRDVIFNETKFFDTYKKIDLFKKEEKKLYVTYCAIFMQIFENNDEKQYNKVSIRKFVLNNFKKINFFICIEKFRFIEDNVAIIIYVVFLWISNSKNIDEIIFYQIFNKCSRFHLFIFFKYICFFKSENVLQLNILRWAI